MRVTFDRGVWSNRSKPIIALYLQIFSTVILKLTGSTVVITAWNTAEKRLRMRQWTFPLLHEILRKFKIGKKYHHSLKEHPKFSKIAEFGCEML